MTGPSAMGSENGTPSSITSAPALASACMRGTVTEGAGSPAVTYGISAFLRSRARRSNVAWILDMLAGHGELRAGRLLVEAAQPLFRGREVIGVDLEAGEAPP